MGLSFHPHPPGLANMYRTSMARNGFWEAQLTVRYCRQKKTAFNLIHMVLVIQDTIMVMMTSGRILKVDPVLMVIGGLQLLTRSMTDMIPATLAPHYTVTLAYQWLVPRGQGLIQRLGQKTLRLSTSWESFRVDIEISNGRLQNKP